MICADYHIHTKFCNHAEESIFQYINQAIKCGLKEILFLDHLTLFEQDFKNSMTIKEVPLYLYAVRNAAEQFKDKIKVKCGLETDYHPNFFHKTQEICSKFDFDMIGASVHFVDNYNIVSRSRQKTYSHIKDVDIISGYFEAMSQMIQYDFFDTICHFDVIFKFPKTLNTSETEIISSQIDNILDIVAQKQIAIEINTSGYTHNINRQYPAEEILKKCITKQIPFTVGSDAHSPLQIARNFECTKKLLTNLHLNKIYGYEKRKPYEIHI